MNRIANVENVVCSVDTMSRHPELFHYTKPEAFEGIVKSQTFWASHYREMLDNDEVLLMRDLLPVAVAPRFEAIVAPLSRHDRRLFKAAGGGLGVAKDFVNSLYGATLDGKASYAVIDVYMVSFSTHSHDSDFDREHGLSSQWKEYAGPAGFCLVFDIAEMARMLGKEMDSRYWVRLTLDPVRYADAPIEDLFPELVHASTDTLRKFLSGVRYPEMAVPEFLAGATLLKGAGYRPEREIRIVAIPGTGRLSKQAAKEYPTDFKNLPLPEVRTQPGATKRYIPIFDNLGLKLPIKRVIVGPGDRQDERAAIARLLVGDMPVFCSRCST
jgi:hypothetical protein